MGQNYIMGGRLRRNSVNMIQSLKSQEIPLCFMYMYVSCEKDEEVHETHPGICYIYMYITCWRSGLKNDLIYKVIFEVFHHTESSETPYADYLH